MGDFAGRWGRAENPLTAETRVRIPVAVLKARAVRAESRIRPRTLAWMPRQLSPGDLIVLRPA
jgi:hypothetical protein